MKNPWKFVDSGFVKTWDEQNSIQPQKILHYEKNEKKRENFVSTISDSKRWKQHEQ